MRNLFPTTGVRRGLGPERSLPTASAERLEEIEFRTLIGPTTRVNDWLASSYTDGLLMMSYAKIVSEQYFNDKEDHTPHLS